MLLDTSLLKTQHYKVLSRVKLGNPEEGVAPSPTPRCSSYWKGSLQVALEYGRQLYTHIYIYIYIYSSTDFLAQPFSVAKSWDRNPPNLTSVRKHTSLPKGVLTSALKLNAYVLEVDINQDVLITILLVCGYCLSRWSNHYQHHRHLYQSLPVKFSLNRSFLIFHPIR